MKVSVRLLMTLGEIFIAMIVLLTLSGCEDVIDVNLNSAEPRIVIEGQLRWFNDNSTVGCRFEVKRTTDYYHPTQEENISGATIVLSDDTGYTDTLVGTYSILGYSYYTIAQPPATIGRTYTATVTVEGKTYSASTTMPAPLSIDSVGAEYQDGGGFGSLQDPGYRLHVYFNDRRNEADYARILIGNWWESTDEYYLYDGKFSDGNQIDYDYFLTVFPQGYGYCVDLVSMDKVMYDYFLTLSEVAASQEGNSFDVTPANPNTNWNNGALGYFGAFCVDRQCDVLPSESE